MKRLAVALVLAIVAAAPLSADLSKYKDWGSSPQGYFMTKAERAQWASIRTDDEAQAFVDKFLASRGPNFAADVADRAAKADQYFTVAKTPGSKALRGKVVILLGPPSGMDVAVKPIMRGHSAHSDAALGEGGSHGGGATVGDIADVATRDSMSSTDSGVRLYTFSYDGSKVPTKKNFSVTLEVDTRNGSDRPQNKAAAAELDDMFERAAQASITASK